MHARPKRWPLLRAAVEERSMLPALHPGDWLLALRTTRIRPGQIVLAWHPQRPGFLLVKRAVRRVEGDGEAGWGWWLESDNPAAGAVDSTRFGPVREELIVGAGAWSATGRPAAPATPPSYPERTPLTASGPAPPQGAGPDADGPVLRRGIRIWDPRSAWCTPRVRQLSALRHCLSTSLSISSLGSLVYIAQ